MSSSKGTSATPTDAQRGDGLAIEYLTVSYGRAAIVSDLTVHIRRGEIVGLIGLNGSGKSTLLRAVAGVIDLFGGRIERGTIFFDSERASVRENSGATTIAFSPDGGRLFQSLSVEDNVLASLRSARTPATREDARTILKKLLPRPPDLRKSGGELSGGERSLVSVARTLVSRAPCILLDEPAAGLAHSAKANLASTLKQEASIAGRCIFLSAHDLEWLDTFADRVLGIREGSVSLDVRASDERLSLLKEFVSSGKLSAH